MSLFDWLFPKYKEPETIPEVKIPEPKLYSYRVREVVYGSGIKDYYLEQYIYPKYDSSYLFSRWSDYSPVWKEVKKYITRESAIKAMRDYEETDFKRSIISDTVISP